MLAADVLFELTRLATRVGITVRTEPFEPFARLKPEDGGALRAKGGLCWLHGKPLVMIDAGSSTLDRIGVLATALAEFDLEAIYVPPAIRRAIAARARTTSAVSARRTPAPQRRTS